MGKNKKQQSPADDLHQTLSDFTSKENWDKFFTLRGSDDAFEWYAEWPELKESLLSELASISPDAAVASYSLQILVPGCGNSKLSEHLYDGGFHGITNIDFSKVVISDMLRRNVRERPAMRWRVMDMTSMQFADNMFDAIVDKGGLDALMEPEHGQKLGSQYLMEAMRVLKSGGKFICLTLAESHVLGLLFSTLRFGWKMIIHAIPQKPSNKRSFRTFMVVTVKETHGVVHQITSSFDQSTLNCDDRQASGLYEELKNENKVRMDYSNGSDILLSLGDLRLGAKGNLDELCPGRRVLLNLGDHNSQFSYRAVLLDARQQSATFLCDCGVMLVPKSRSHGWLYSTEEGQWTVVESAKAARLIMVFLDNIHMKASMDDIQRDLSPLIKQLAPATNKYGSQIPFMMIDDALKERKLVHEVSSPLIGPIVIDDVVYNNVDNGVSHILPQQGLIFRRLIFQRNEDLVQSEALLMRQGSTVKNSGDKRSSSSSRSKKKGDHRSNGSEQTLRICHDYLASPYHTGIISGFMLISSHLEAVASKGRAVRAAVIGLGAGLLPMFLHGCMSFMHVEVVELDPVIVSLAKKYFSFCDDNRLKVHVTDGVEFVKAAASNSLTNGDSPDKTESHDSFYSSDMISPKSLLEDKGNRMDILIVDVDSDDPSSGLSCPAANFVEEPFLNDAKNSISRQGLFVVNLVSRSAAIKETVISRMKKVFNLLYSLRLEEDVNEIIFAVKTDSHITDDLFSEAAVRLEKLLSCRDPKMSETIIDASKKIRYLK